MINNDERIKRQITYEIAKKNSENQGVPLTQETEAIKEEMPEWLEAVRRFDSV